jgi:hypothetical protein
MGKSSKYCLLKLYCKKENQAYRKAHEASRKRPKITKLIAEPIAKFRRRPLNTILDQWWYSSSKDIVLQPHSIPTNALRTAFLDCREFLLIADTT